MAFLIDKIGEDVINDAVKSGMVVKHTPAGDMTGAVAADAAKAGASMDLLTKFGTYGAVFALGMVVAAVALGKSLDVNVVDRGAGSPPPAVNATASTGGHR